MQERAGLATILPDLQVRLSQLQILKAHVILYHTSSPTTHTNPYHGRRPFPNQDEINLDSDGDKIPPLLNSDGVLPVRTCNLALLLNAALSAAVLAHQLHTKLMVVKGDDYKDLISHLGIEDHIKNRGALHIPFDKPFRLKNCHRECPDCDGTVCAGYSSTSPHAASPYFYVNCAGEHMA
ncbi:hypothetical protein C8R43DRAFT_1143387 [Mycena crocata]|nr:hypothetical protein C8R43DRAFT_1143387 [Mycena crocata]